jgi:HlyD family secretion protein
MNMYESIKQHKIITTLFLFIVGGGALFLVMRRDSSPRYEFVVATRSDVIQEVSVTGRVKPAKSVNLAFQSIGKIANVFVEVSDRVRAGDILVSQESGDIIAQLDQARAQLKVQQAVLDKLRRGTREEEIEVQRVKVDNAEIARMKEEQNLIDTIHRSYTKAEDGVRNKIDQFIDDPRSSNPQISFIVDDRQLEINAEANRATIEQELVAWEASLTTLSSASDLDAYASSGAATLAKTKLFLQVIALIINDLSASSEVSQATIDSYRTDVASARATVDTAIADLSATRKKVADAKSALNLETQELALLLAGTIPETLDEQEAKVEEAQANVALFTSELAKRILRSPIDGVVTTQDAKVGEIVAANKTLISLISLNEFEIEAHVPEVDITKLHLGDVAAITLDAYGSDVLFEAIVTSIDPAETILEGVSTYTTTFQFSGEDERIRSGMTANIDVTTRIVRDAIAVPARSVITQNGVKVIRIVGDDGYAKEVPVKTGLRGSRGNIEIVTGIKEGDNVILFIEE